MFSICFWLTVVAVFTPITDAKIPVDFIVGGVNAKDGEVPYQVSLQNNKKHYCGGSIISNCWILTAGQCVDGYSASSLSILAGTNKLNSSGVRAEVEKIIRHEKYEPPINDIALIKLKQCLKYTKKIQAVKLLSTRIGDGVSGTVTGWGFTNQNGNAVTNDLKKLNVRTITNEQCAKELGFGVIPDGDICTYNGLEEGFCEGDLGGPLVEESTKGQMGIASINTLCGIGRPDIYTRISNYVQWITDNTK